MTLDLRVVSSSPRLAIEPPKKTKQQQKVNRKLSPREGNHSWFFNSRDWNPGKALILSKVGLCTVLTHELTV